MPRYKVTIPGVDVDFDIGAKDTTELNEKVKALKAKYPAGTPAGSVVVGERQKAGPNVGPGGRPEIPGQPADYDYENAPKLGNPFAAAKRFFTPTPEESPIPAPVTAGQKKVAAARAQGLGPSGRPEYEGKPAGYDPSQVPATAATAAGLGRVGEEPAFVPYEPEEPEVPVTTSQAMANGGKFLASTASKETVNSTVEGTPKNPFLGKYYTQVQKPDGSVVPVRQEMRDREVILPDGRKMTIKVPHSEFAGKEAGEAPYRFLGQSGPQDDRVVMGEKTTVEDTIGASDIAAPALARGVAGIAENVARMPELRDRIASEAARMGARGISKLLGRSPEETAAAEKMAGPMGRLAVGIASPSTLIDQQVARPVQQAAAQAQATLGEHPALAAIEPSAQGLSAKQWLSDPRVMAKDIAENAPQLGAAIGTAAVSPALAVPFMFSLEAGGQMGELDQLRAQGKPISEARYLASTVGTSIVNSVLDTLGAITTAGKVMKTFPGLAERVGKLAGTAAAKIGIGLVGEAGTEFLQEYTSILSSYLAEKNPQSVEEVAQLLTDPKNVNRALKAGLVGGILGGGGAGVETAYEKLGQAAQDWAQRRWINQNVPKAPEGAIPPPSFAQPPAKGGSTIPQEAPPVAPAPPPAPPEAPPAPVEPGPATPPAPVAPGPQEVQPPVAQRPKPGDTGPLYEKGTVENGRVRDAYITDEQLKQAHATIATLKRGDRFEQVTYPGGDPDVWQFDGGFFVLTDDSGEQTGVVVHKSTNDAANIVARSRFMGNPAEQAPPPAPVAPPEVLPPPAPPQPERRVDQATRKKVSEMSPEERADALLVNHKSGLPSERAYEETPRRAHIASADLDGLGYMNDEFGEAAGDGLLAAAGQVAREVMQRHPEVQVFHTHGDEFRWEADDRGRLDAFDAEFRQALENEPIVVQDGEGNYHEITGISFSSGVDTDLKRADRQMKGDVDDAELQPNSKRARQQRGERGAKGQRPPGVQDRPLGREPGRAPAVHGEAQEAGPGAGPEEAPPSEPEVAPPARPKVYSASISREEQAFVEEAVAQSGADAPKLRGGVLEGESQDGYRAVIDAIAAKAGSLPGRARIAAQRLQQKLLQAVKAGPVDSKAAEEEAPAPTEPPAPEAAQAPPEAQGAAPEETGPGSPEKIHIPGLARHFAKAYAGGTKFRLRRAALLEAERVLGGKVDETTPAIRDVDEAIETAKVMAARDVVRQMRQNNAPPDAIREALVTLEKDFPASESRTSESKARQEFSTPVSLSYTLDQLVGVGPDTVVLDNSAGNGAMLIGTDKGVAVELSPKRVQALRAQGIDAAEGDGRILTPKLAVKADVVKVNPPFGAAEGKDAKIEHDLAIAAVDLLRVGGQAAIVVAGPHPASVGNEAARAAHYKSLTAQNFFTRLAKAGIRVDRVFTVAGKLYASSGTTYPIDVITGRKMVGPQEVWPAFLNPPPVLTTEKELEHVLSDETLGATWDRPGGVRRPRAGFGEKPADRGVPRPPATGDSGEGRAGRTDRGGSDSVAGPGDRAGRGGEDRNEPGRVPGGQPQRATDEGAGPGVGGVHPPHGAETGGNAGEGPARGGADVGGRRPGGEGSRGPDVGGLGPTDTGRGRQGVTGKLSDEARRRIEALKKKGEKATEAPTGPALGSPDTAADEADAVSNLLEVAKILQSELGGIPFQDFLTALKEFEFSPKVAPFAVLAYADAYDAASPDVQATMTDPETGLDEWTDDRIRDFMAPAPKAEEAPKPKESKRKVREATKEVTEEKEEEGAELQIPNTPKSKLRSVGSLIPRSLHEATMKALAAVEKAHGDIDEFVRKELGFSKERFYSTDPDEAPFLAEQIDALGLALHQFKQGRGFILADQTGLGKGRVVAAVLSWAIENGSLPIFFTEKSRLYVDMMRDLADIGFPQHEPLVTNNNLNIEMSPGRKFVSNGGKHADLIATAVQAFLDSQKLKGQTAKGETLFDSIFTTYNQLQGPHGAKRFDLLDRIAFGSVVVLDESHNAAGGETLSNQQPRKKKTESVPQHRGKRIARLLSKAKGVLFSSATFAKRPENLIIYAPFTDAGRMSMDPQAVADGIADGGVPLQQAISRMLVESGQMVRREKSFEGIDFNVDVAKADKEMSERVSSATRDLFRIDREMDAHVKQLNKEMSGEAARQGGVGAEVASRTNFASLFNNVVNQTLMALKVPLVVEKVKKLHEAGESPFVTFSNTMEFMLKEADESAEAESGTEEPDVDITFADNLKRYLQKIITIKTTPPGGEPSYHVLTDDELESISPELLRRVEAIRDTLENDETLKAIPGSPLDMVRFHLEKAGLNVAEITGRGFRVDYADATGRKGKIVTRAAEKTPQHQIDIVNGYNQKKGAKKVDVILANQSGSTGISAHNSPKTGENRRRRHMVIVSPEANIDTYMQMLGRINRTGQLDTPEKLPTYTLLTSDLPIETRVAAVLMKKMASLSANTTGSRANVATFDMPDFVNQVGDQVMYQILTDNPELNEALGRPMRTGDKEEKPNVAGLAAKASGRVILLPVNEEAEFYDNLREAYDTKIDELDLTNDNPLVAKTMNLEAEEVSSIEIDPKEDFEGPFAEPVRLGLYKTAAEFRQLTDQELEGVLRSVLAPEKVEVPKLEEPGIKLPAQLPKEEKLISPREYTERLIEQFDKDAEKRKDAIAENIQKTAAKDAPEAEINDRIEAAKMDADLKAGAMRTLLRRRQVGDHLLVSIDGTSMRGVITRIEYGNKLANPWKPSNVHYTIALNDQFRTFRVAASAVSDNGKIQLMRVQGAGAATGADAVKAAVKYMRDNHTGITSRKRAIFTGNAMKAYLRGKDNRGRLVFFTMKDGSTRQGVLMPQVFNANEWLERAPVILKEEKHVVEWLRRSRASLAGLGDGVPLNDLRLSHYAGETFALTCTRQNTMTDTDVLAALKLATNDPDAQFTSGRRGRAAEARIRGAEAAKNFLTALKASGLDVRYEINDYKPLAREIAGMPPMQTLTDEIPAQITIGNVDELAEVFEEYAKEGQTLDHREILGTLHQPTTATGIAPLSGVNFSLRANTKLTGEKKAAFVFSNTWGAAAEILKTIPGAREVDSRWGDKDILVPVESVAAWMHEGFKAQQGADYDPKTHANPDFLRFTFDMSSSKRLRSAMHSQDTGGALGLAGKAGAAIRAKRKSATTTGGMVGPISPNQPRSQRLGGTSNSPKIWAVDDTVAPEERSVVPVRKAEILKRLQLLSGTAVREGMGKFKQRKSHGWYMPKEAQFTQSGKLRQGWTAVKGVSGALRVKDIQDMATVAHEAGHSFHDRVLEWMDLTPNNAGIPALVSEDLKALGRECYGPRAASLKPARLVQEGFAELFSRNLFGMDTNAFPAATAWFFNKVLASRPEFESIYKDTADLIRLYDEQGAQNRVLAHIETKPKTLGQWMARELRPLDELVNLAFDKLTTRLYKQWVDDGVMLRDFLSDGLRASGMEWKDLKISENPYRMRQALEMVAPAMTKYAVETGVIDLNGNLQSKGLKPILEDVEKRYDLTEFMVYAVARRAQDLHARPKPIKTGILDSDIRKIVGDVAADPGKQAAYDEALQGITNWSNAIMRQIVDAGGMSQEQYDLITKMNPVYVPFKRAFDAEIGNFRKRGSGSGGRGSVDRVNPVRKMWGSTKPIADPLESLIRGAENMIDFRNQCLVAKAALNFAERVPWAAKLIQPVSKMEKVASFPLEAITDKLREAGFDDETLKKNAKGLADTIAELWRPATWNRDPKKNVYRLYVNGKPKLFEIDDSVADVFNGAVKNGSDALATMYHKGGWNRFAAKSIRLGATSVSLPFTARNVFRDAFNASVFTQWGPGRGTGLVKLLEMPGVMHVSGAKSMWTHDQAAEMFKAFGGEMATFQASNQAALERFTRETFKYHQTAAEKVGQRVLHPLQTMGMGIDAASNVLGVFESMPRVAEFEKAFNAARDRGLTKADSYLEALLAAKDVTTNFTRAGTLSRVINQAIPFFNARIQGADKFLRAFRDDPTRFSNASKRIFLASAMRLTALGMLFWWFNKDDDDYQRMKDYERERFWVIPKKVFGRLVKIPKPDSLGQAFVSIPEKICDALWHKGSDEVRNQIASTVVDLLDALAPVQMPENLADPLQWAKVQAEMLPAGSKILLETGFNFSSFRKGQPIYPEWKMGRHERTDWIQPGTTLSAQKIALAHRAVLDQLGLEKATGTGAYQGMQIPPVFLDYGLGAATGGLGLDALRAMDWVGRQLEKGPKKEQPGDASDLPVVGWAFQRPESSKAVDQVYSEAQSLAQKAGSRKLDVKEQAKADRLRDAIERFREARKHKAETPEERKKRAAENNEIAVKALGWGLRSERAGQPDKRRRMLAQ